MRPASQRFFIHRCIYLRILIISYLATFLGTNNLSVLMYRKAVNQSKPLLLVSGIIHPEQNDHHQQNTLIQNKQNNVSHGSMA